MFGWISEWIDSCKRNAGQGVILGEGVSKDGRMVDIKIPFTGTKFDSDDAFFLELAQTGFGDLSRKGTPLAGIRFTSVDGYMENSPKFPSAWYKCQNGEVNISTEKQIKQSDGFDLSIISQSNDNLEVGLLYKGKLISDYGTFFPPKFNQWKNHYDKESGIFYDVEQADIVLMRMAISELNKGMQG